MEFMQKARLHFLTSSMEDMMLNSNYVQRFIDERCDVRDAEEIWGYFYWYPEVGNSIAKNYRLSNDQRWIKMINELAKPKLTAIGAGAKESGKTALGFAAGEELHRRFGLRVCCFRPLDFRDDLLPKYFYPAYDESEIEPKSFLFYDEAAIFMCLPKKTLVKIPNSLEEIRNLIVGDKILSFNFSSGKKEVDTVTTIQINKQQKLKITLENGDILFSSPEHRWFVKNNKRILLKKAKDLNNDDAIIFID